MGGKKEFQCDWCPKTFGQNCYLRIHMKTVHGGMQDFQCEECSKKFGVKGRKDPKIFIWSAHIKVTVCPCKTG